MGERLQGLVAGIALSAGAGYAFFRWRISLHQPRIAIYWAIDLRRARQDRQWGGPAHDDQHSEYDWTLFVTHQAWHIYRDYGSFRERMLNIAALAVAAIESFDRKQLGEKED